MKALPALTIFFAAFFLSATAFGPWTMLRTLRFGLGHNPNAQFAPHGFQPGVESE
jgi:hypothetical protein